MNSGGDYGFLQAVLSLPSPNNWDALRKCAKEWARTSPLPSNDQEEWKYLDLNPIFSQTFRPPAYAVIQAQPIDAHLATETTHSRLVFTNGHIDSHLSDTVAIDDKIHFTNLTNFSGTLPEPANFLGRIATQNASDFFANINTASFEDGVLLHVPKEHCVEAPLHVVFRSIGAETGALPFFFPRIMIVLESGAKARLIEEYFGQRKYLTNSVVEIVLGEGAILKHDRVQREGIEAFHFCGLHADIARSASYSLTSISMGAAISRHRPIIALTGAHAEVELNGLSMASAEQTANTHSLIDHTVPDCHSRQLQKYVLDGSAHGIFNGQIFVRPGAQRTNASQSSRNLLLTEGARIDTKPQLEIFADDVKCSHGAAVGQLDDEELFYLQSRGLDMNSAKNMLLAGFASDIINNLTQPSLRHGLIQHMLGHKLADYQAPTGHVTVH
ncbi:MAG: Fe-S cluster assembly protein SufD [Holophagaceae bacterium]|nr:Fe-S cluster assembly protein SufD [Holophagaceae bacterium]